MLSSVCPMKRAAVKAMLQGFLRKFYSWFLEGSLPWFTELFVLRAFNRDSTRNFFLIEIGSDFPSVNPPGTLSGIAQRTPSVITPFDTSWITPGDPFGIPAGVFSGFLANKTKNTPEVHSDILSDISNSNPPGVTSGVPFGVLPLIFMQNLFEETIQPVYNYSLSSFAKKSSGSSLLGFSE